MSAAAACLLRSRISLFFRESGHATVGQSLNQEAAKSNFLNVTIVVTVRRPAPAPNVAAADLPATFTG
jgi:hypothetical protein